MHRLFVPEPFCERNAIPATGATGLGFMLQKSIQSAQSIRFAEIIVVISATY
jgi:hypothetical protein